MEADFGLSQNYLIENVQEHRRDGQAMLDAAGCRPELGAAVVARVFFPQSALHGPFHGRREGFLVSLLLIIEGFSLVC